jgi:hypothetical protein
LDCYPPKPWDNKFRLFCYNSPANKYTYQFCLQITFPGGPFLVSSFATTLVQSFITSYPTIATDSQLLCLLLISPIIKLALHHGGLSLPQLWPKNLMIGITIKAIIGRIRAKCGDIYLWFCYSGGQARRSITQGGPMQKHETLSEKQTKAKKGLVAWLK